MHVIAAVSAYEQVYWTRRRGAFNAENASDWIMEMLEHLPQGVNPDNVIVIVCAITLHVIRAWNSVSCTRPTHTGLKILRMAPYSVMLKLQSRVTCVCPR